MNREFQMGFDFFLASIGNSDRVRTLNRFEAENVKGNRCFGGQLREVAYSTWLRWSSPLSPSWQEIVSP
jgi:hypothetical protein